MELPSIYAVVKKNKVDKRGNCPIMIRIVFQRKAFEQITGFKIAPELFTLDKLIHKDVDNAAYKNRHIREQMAALEGQFLKATHPLTLEKVKSIIHKDQGNSITILNLAKKITATQQGILHKNTIKSWNSAANKLDAWRPGITVNEVTPALLNSFEQYMRVDLKNSHNTLWGTMKRLKRMFNLAKLDGNPFLAYDAPGYKQTKRDYLQSEEIAAIEKYADTGANETLRMVAAWFVFSCYSGLRYGDLGIWNEGEMIKGDKLYFSDQKTGTPHFIPLYPELNKAIERIRKYRNIPTNQKCNAYLKDLLPLLEVKLSVKLKMNVARHSFAVTYLEKGGKMEVLQKLMGHSTIKTTSIYGQITDKRINEEVGRVLGGK